MVTKLSDTVAGGAYEHLLRYDPVLSSGLTAAFTGGWVSNNRLGGTLNLPTPVAVVLPDDAGSDIYFKYDDGTLTTDPVQDNLLLIYSAVTASGVISSMTDKRSLAQRRIGTSGPRYGSYNAAVSGNLPDHWWKLDEPLNGLGSGLNVTDYGLAGTLYDGATDGTAANHTQGNIDPDEWSYKIEKSEEIDWGTKSGGVIPADLEAASVGTFTYMFRIDQDDSDAPSIEDEGVLCVFEKAADASWDNIWMVKFTERGEQGDMPNFPHRLLTYRVETAATNFYQLQYDLKDWYDGQWHTMAIVQDGVAVQVYMDGANITSDMTETTGGSGVDATSWWDTPGADLMRIGNSSNTPIGNLTHFGSHLAFFLRALSAQDALDLWESVQQPSTPQGTNVHRHFDLSSEWAQTMLKTKPTSWWPLSESAGPIIYDWKGGNTSTGFVSNASNVTFGGAGPGGTGLSHIVISNSGADESAGIRLHVGPHGDQFGTRKYFGIGGWFYVNETSVSAETALFYHLPRTTGNDGVRMWLTSGRLIRCLLWDASSGVRRTTIESTAAVSLQAWHHVIWLMNDTATGWQLFIDGVEDTTFTIDPDTTGSTSIIYGHDDQPVAASGITGLGHQLDQGSTSAATYGTRMAQPHELWMSNWAIWNNVHSQANSNDHQRIGVGATGNQIADLWDLGRGV